MLSLVRVLDLGQTPFERDAFDGSRIQVGDLGGGGDQGEECW